MGLLGRLIGRFQKKQKSLYADFERAKEAARAGGSRLECHVNPDTMAALADELTASCRFFCWRTDKRGVYLALGGIRMRENPLVRLGEWRFARIDEGDGSRKL